VSAGLGVVQAQDLDVGDPQALVLDGVTISESPGM
jgi:hypothetical protein